MPDSSRNPNQQPESGSDRFGIPGHESGAGSGGYTLPGSGSSGGYPLPGGGSGSYPPGGGSSGGYPLPGGGSGGYPLRGPGGSSGGYPIPPTVDTSANSGGYTIPPTVDTSANSGGYTIPPTVDTGSALISPTTEGSRGGKQIGHYRTLRELGRGSFGVVYLAQHVGHGHQVALKLLLNREGGEELKRFFREGELASKLSHPGIVRVLDRGVHQNLPWLAMEYCPGTNLRERLRMGAMSIPHACELVVQVAEAVEAAHAQGVIHRDLKPANILIDAKGRPRLTDFGLARNRKGQSMTLSGDGLGSPLYMPPEQFADAKHVDERGDVYALGLVLYEALTAKRPFEGTTVLELTRAIHAGEIVPLRVRRPEVSAALATVCERAFAHDTQDRYPSARAFREAVNAVRPSAPASSSSFSKRAPLGAKPVPAGGAVPFVAPQPLGAPAPPTPQHYQPAGQQRGTLKVILAGLTVGLALASAVTVGVQIQRRQQASDKALEVARAWVVEGSPDKAREAFDHAVSVGADDTGLAQALDLLEGFEEAEAALYSGNARPARELAGRQGDASELTPWLAARNERLTLRLRVHEAAAEPRVSHALDETIDALLRQPDMIAARDELGQKLLDEARRRSRDMASFAELTKLLERARKVTASADLRDEIELEVASVHFRRGRFADATRLAKRLSRRTDRIGLQAAYVSAYGKVWRDPLQGEGLDELHALWKRDPDGVVGLNAGAVWHSHKGMNARGEELATEALRLDPTYVDAYISLGFCRNDQFHTAGDRTFLERSVEASSKAIELMPDHPRAYLARAYALGNLGKSEQTLADYDTLIKLTEPRPMSRALRHRAQRRLQRNDNAGALEDLTRALDRDPNSPEALILRGFMYDGLGRRDDALRDWARGYKANPRMFQAVLGQRYNKQVQQRVIEGLRELQQRAQKQ